MTLSKGGQSTLLFRGKSPLKYADCPLNINPKQKSVKLVSRGGGGGLVALLYPGRKEKTDLPPKEGKEFDIARKRWPVDLPLFFLKDV